MKLADNELPLRNQKCSACDGSVEPLNASQIKGLFNTLDDDWRVVDEHHLFRAFHFSNFKKALKFTNRVGELAEEEGHHPDILLGWGKAEVSLWTHSVDGLTLNDFILASKISEIWSQKGRARSK
jgi:4a-hydroxytetrahydrobiopterin dehydratase